MHVHFDCGTEGQCGAMFDDARHAENPLRSNLPNFDRIEYQIKDIIRKSDALRRAFSTASHGGGSVVWSTEGRPAGRAPARSGRQCSCSTWQFMNMPAERREPPEADRDHHR